MYEDNIKKKLRKMYYPDAGLTEMYSNSVPQQALKLLNSGSKVCICVCVCVYCKELLLLPKLRMLNEAGYD